MPQTPGWSRRDLLRSGGALTVASVAGAFLTACGGSQAGSAKPPASPPPGKTLPAGVRSLGPAGGPGVLLLHAWWGVTPGVLAWARTLGDAGARVLVPDLYDGALPRTADEAETMVDALDDGDVEEQLDACASALAEGGGWSALGWSLGAFHASRLMTRPHAPTSAVLFYGGAPLDGATTTKRVQAHLVPDDRYFTAEEVTGTLDSLRSAGTQVQRFDYPGLRHWFAEPGSPAYDASGAARAQQRAMTFLRL